MDAIFGKKPKLPTPVEQKKPIEKIVQGEDQSQITQKLLAKRKKATILNQVTQPANIKRQSLGAG